MGDDGKPVVPTFPAAKTAAGLRRQVQDYDAHLRLARTASQTGMNLALTKFDVEQDMKAAALGGHIAKAKTLQSKYEKLDAQEGGLNDTVTKQMAQALGLYRAIVASRLYAGHLHRPPRPSARWPSVSTSRIWGRIN